MGIFRTNDPTQFDDIDGIIVDETAPPANITGVAANIAIIVMQTQRGPANELSLPLGSIGEFQEIYGKSSFSGNKQLKNKRFGSLKTIRVLPDSSAAATKTFNETATPTIKFDALFNGDYGNNIKVTIEDGSEAVGKKYTVEDTNTNAVLPIEIYDQIEIANVDASTFAASALIAVTVLDTNADPDNIAATSLATGSDGTVIDTDYEAAIAIAEQERSGNVLLLDVYNTVRNAFLKTHASTTADKMVIVCSQEDDDKAAAIADVSNNRDSAGRIIYAWPYVQTLIDGALEFTPPASWYASIFSQVSPHIALSKTSNTGFLGGITALRFNESRAGFISLDAAGVSAMERDPDIGFIIKNAIVTQIIDSSKRTILRRRMADFLTDSIALFLKNFQNSENSRDRRDEVKGGILDFDARLVLAGIVPGEQDVKTGAPLLVDTESLNTDSVIAAGFFKILYKRRIFSSMRYIVLQAEIGESVVVTEV